MNYTMNYVTEIRRVWSGVIFSLVLFFSTAVEAGTISGQITDPVSKAGIDGVSVYAYDTSWKLATETKTNAGGQYTLTTSDGNYYLYIYKKDYVAKYYNSSRVVYAYDLASTINTTATKPAKINMTLTKGATIQGRVTDNKTGKPLSKMIVMMYDSNSNQVSWNYTDDNGNYIMAVDPGSYYLRTFDVTGYYVNQYPDGTVNGQNISSQKLSNGQQLTGVNFSLQMANVAIFSDKASYTVGEAVNLYVSMVKSTTPVDIYIVIAHPDGTFKSIKRNLSLSNSNELIPFISKITPINISPAIKLMNLNTTGWATGSYGIYITLAYSGYYPGYSSNQYFINYNIFTVTKNVTF